MSRPSKRSRREDPEAFSSTTSGGRAAKPIHAPLPPLQVTKSVDLNFRSLSTCNRCRIRKHRCDQRLPICANCEKVGVLCIGYDPVTKKEIPRRYRSQCILLTATRAPFDIGDIAMFITSRRAWRRWSPSSTSSGFRIPQQTSLPRMRQPIVPAILP